MCLQKLFLYFFISFGLSVATLYNIESLFSWLYELQFEKKKKKQIAAQFDKILQFERK